MNATELPWAQKVIDISVIAGDTAGLLSPHDRNRVYYAALHIAKVTAPVVEE